MLDRVTRTGGRERTEGTPKRAKGFSIIPVQVNDVLPALSLAEKAIVLALAKHTDGQDECQASVETLSKTGGVSGRTVGRALASLQGRGLITRRRRGPAEGGERQTTVTTWDSDKTPESSGHQGPHETSFQQDIGRISTGHPCPPPDQMDGEGVPSPIKTGSVSVDQNSACPAQEIFDSWNQIPGVRHARDLTRTRKDRMDTRWGEKTFRADWREAMAKIGKSDFCKGKIPGKKWKANLDWFLKPDSVTKAMEDTYDEEPSNDGTHRRSPETYANVAKPF